MKLYYGRDVRGIYKASLNYDTIRRYSFDGNISSGDATNKRSKSNTYKNVVNNLSKSRANIVLMHDIYGSTVEAVKDIIKYGKENGYTFEKITMDTPMYTHVVNNR